jgi:serine/threonine-protein kinase
VLSSGPRVALLDEARGGAPVEAGAPSGRRRRRWAWIALLVVLALGAVAGGVLAYLAAQPTSAVVPRLLTLDQAAAEAEVAATEAAVEDGLDWDLQVRAEHNEVVGAGFVVDQDPPPGTELDDGGTVAIVVSLGPPPRAVPDLTAATEDEARAAIEVAELVVGDREERHVEDVEAGRVVTWSVDDQERPAEVPKGSEVDLVVSIGPAPRVVPDLAGAAREAAEAELGGLGLVAEVSERFSTTVDRGVVIGSEPGPGASVARGSTVGLVVSKGRDLVPVPDVSGMTQDEAITALRAGGLIADQVSGPAGGLVNATDPAAGASVDRNTLVDLFLRR